MEDLESMEFDREIWALPLLLLHFVLGKCLEALAARLICLVLETWLEASVLSSPFLLSDVAACPIAEDKCIAEVTIVFSSVRKDKSSSPSSTFSAWSFAGRSILSIFCAEIRGGVSKALFISTTEASWLSFVTVLEPSMRMEFCSACRFSFLKMGGLVPSLLLNLFDPTAEAGMVRMMVMLLVLLLLFLLR